MTDRARATVTEASDADGRSLFLLGFDLEDVRSMIPGGHENSRFDRLFVRRYRDGDSSDSAQDTGEVTGIFGIAVQNDEEAGVEGDG